MSDHKRGRTCRFLRRRHHEHERKKSCEHKNIDAPDVRAIVRELFAYEITRSHSDHRTHDRARKSFRCCHLYHDTGNNATTLLIIVDPDNVKRAQIWSTVNTIFSTLILAESVSGPLSESDCPNSVRPARESVCTRHDTTRSLISINKYPLCLGQNREQLSSAGSLNAYAMFHIGVHNKREPISPPKRFSSACLRGWVWAALSYELSYSAIL